MPDLIATVGDSTANSFVTLDEFDAFLDERLNAASILTSRDDDDRTRALLEASRDINKLPFVGSRVNSTQRLAWPRQYAVDPDKPNPSLIIDLQELYFDNDIIPTRIKEAVYEYALELLRAGSTDLRQRSPDLDLKSSHTGPLSKEFDSNRPEGLARFPSVVAALYPLLDVRALGGSLQVMRV